MKIKTLVLAVATLASLPAMADMSYNLSATSDYRYRGLSQTDNGAALQGGADYTNESGFYAGAWASTITWIDDAGGGANIEFDFYAGKTGKFSDAVPYDFGVLTYQYPSHDLAVSPNTTEIYGKLGFGPAYVKYSHSVTDLFGFEDSDGSGYLDVGANIGLADTWTLDLHVGNQDVKNYDDYSYTDYLIGVTKDFGFMTGSLAMIGTDLDAAGDLGDNGVVLTIKKVF